MTGAALPSPFAVTVFTLYPEAFPGPLGVSLIGGAREKGLWSLDTHQIRDFAENKHNRVDDTPTGGGAGMVMRADVAARAVDSVPANHRPLIYPSPRGAPLSQAMVRGWAQGPGLRVFCGRFEGLDQRVIEARDMVEVCVGDAVLAGGEVAAMLLIEACVRLLPDVLGNPESLVHESFETDLLEHPLYTRPREWEGRGTPEVLLSGDHARIEAWRQAERLKITKARRG